MLKKSIGAFGALAFAVLLGGCTAVQTLLQERTPDETVALVKSVADSDRPVAAALDLLVEAGGCADVAALWGEASPDLRTDEAASGGVELCVYMGQIAAAVLPISAVVENDPVAGACARTGRHYGSRFAGFDDLRTSVCGVPR